MCPDGGPGSEFPRKLKAAFCSGCHICASGNRESVNSFYLNLKSPNLGVYCHGFHGNHSPVSVQAGVDGWRFFPGAGSWLGCLLESQCPETMGCFAFTMKELLSGTVAYKLGHLAFQAGFIGIMSRFVCFACDLFNVADIGIASPGQSFGGVS